MIAEHARRSDFVMPVTDSHEISPSGWEEIEGRFWRLTASCDLYSLDSGCSITNLIWQQFKKLPTLQNTP